MKKEMIIKMLFCVLLSIIVITICSKNSFLYKFNDWVDANAFFTMGKGWMNGLIPYRDLFEQKGPLLYLIYGIGYLISNTNFIGIYILEIVSFTIFNYYIIKIIELYIEKKNTYLIVILTTSIIVSSNFFVHGGSAEEFCLPLLAYSFYSLIKLFDSNVYNKKSLFINGILAGLISLVKFNLLGFWFIWMVVIFSKLLINKKIKESIYSCLIFLAGMLIPIIISILYFAINNSLKEYIEAYVTFNFSAYTTDVTLIGRTKHLIHNFSEQFVMNRLLFHLISFGFIGILFTNKIFKNMYVKIFTILSFAFLGIGIYIGGEPYNYYFLLNEFYIIFGLLILFILFKDKIINIKYKKIIYTLLVLMTIGISSYQIKKCLNLYYLNLNKDYFSQYTFDEIIKEIDNPTILNYDNLDGGFYTVSNILPNTKYFMRQNIPYERYPKILDEQNKIIKNKSVDFIIIREYFGNIGYHSSIPYLNENYDLIKEQNQLYEGMDFKYLLYKKKGDKNEKNI